MNKHLISYYLFYFSRLVIAQIQRGEGCKFWELLVLSCNYGRRRTVIYHPFKIKIVCCIGVKSRFKSFSSVQSLSLVQLFATPWTIARQASLSITNSWSLLKLISSELVMPSNHLSLCHLLLLPSIFPSIRVFSNESVIHKRWPNYWSFSFSVSPSNEYSGLISLRIDWLDLLPVLGTLKSLLQHHSSKASILWHSAFFIVQLSHPYMTTGKTIALTRWIFVSKAMSLFFNMLSRLVIAFLPGSKRLLIHDYSHHLQ
uniref:Uncharacterized protein n=2 Tax=Ovis aries TaxID=9940 RepID=A0AC11EP28_SHEEP